MSETGCSGEKSTGESNGHTGESPSPHVREQEHHPVWVDVRDATELKDERSFRARVRDWLMVETPEPDWMPNMPLIEPLKGRIGICCSGGGIRSASYNLGALQVLREEGVLGEAEYISAVSGGSYIAAAYAAMTSYSPPRDEEKPIYAPASPEEEYLRNHSSYLAPGLGGKARLLLRVLLGMVVNLLFVGLAVAIVALPLGWLSRLGYPQLAQRGASGALNVKAWMWLAPTAPAAIAIAFAVPDLLFHLGKDAQRSWLEAWTARLMALAVILAIVLLLVPQVLLWAREVGHANPRAVVEHLNNSTPEASQKASEKATGLLQSINLGAILTAIAGALRAFVARKRSYFVLLAAAIAGPLVVITPALWLFNQGAAQGPHGSAMLWALLGAAGLAGALWLVADLTQWSLHPFYRRRLSSAFFVRRARAGTAQERDVAEIPYEHEIKVSELQYEPGLFPDLIVCATANVSDEGATPPGRRASPFTFSRLEIGGPIGALRATDYEMAAAGALRTITLPAAVAMSGAAVSPEMGKKTIKALSFLLALTNVRLGVWVPNPRRVDGLSQSRFDLGSDGSGAGQETLERLVGRKESADGHTPGWFTRRRPTPLYLFKELFGWTSVKDRFLYITDGGHFDNLGLIELLRRGCTTIFCLDAGGDPSGNYSALGEAVALARSELQVDIQINPTPIKPGTDRIAPQDSVVGRYRFRMTPERKDAGSVADDEDTQWMGELVYCRAAVTEDAPWDVRAFHESDKRFPYHSTFDQLFNDQKFESYRALGAHTVRKAVVARHRRFAREAIRGILIRIARDRATITTTDLLGRVDQHLLAARVTTLRPLLEEISELEESARRPRLLLVIHEGGRIDDATNALLEALYDYWKDAPDPI
jgi:Patatin-like phospholipase